jgi:hypothetical protein
MGIVTISQIHGSFADSHAVGLPQRRCEPGKALGVGLLLHRTAPPLDFSVDYRLRLPCLMRDSVRLGASRQRPILDRTHWPPLKASVNPGLSFCRLTSTKSASSSALWSSVAASAAPGTDVITTKNDRKPSLCSIAAVSVSGWRLKPCRTYPTSFGVRRGELRRVVGALLETPKTGR